MTKPFFWYWASGQEPESYAGETSSREAVIAAAIAEGAQEDGFTIIEANFKTLATNVFSAENVIEQYEELNYECWGEDGSMIHTTKEQDAELEGMLNQALLTWMDKHEMHGYPFAFHTTRNKEYFPPLEASTNG